VTVIADDLATTTDDDLTVIVTDAVVSLAELNQVVDTDKLQLLTPPVDPEVLQLVDCWFVPAVTSNVIVIPLTDTCARPTASLSW